MGGVYGGRVWEDTAMRSWERSFSSLTGGDADLVARAASSEDFFESRVDWEDLVGWWLAQLPYDAAIVCAAFYGGGLTAEAAAEAAGCDGARGEYLRQLAVEFLAGHLEGD